MSDLSTGSNSTGLAAMNVVNGVPVLFNSLTVHDGNPADVLTAGTGVDWFFIDHDTLIGQKPGDGVTYVGS
jgi:hypothetical protein